MIIAITGGTGFIGKCLVQKHLQKGDKVRLLSRRAFSLKNDKLTYFKGDLSDTKLNFSNFVENVDILYHCAGEINHENLMRNLHINGMQNLVTAAQGNVNHWVQLSSVGSYGPRKFGIIDENSTESPIGVYETSKTESDNIIKKSGIPYSIMRPSNVIGLDMNNQSLLKFINSIKKRNFFYIGQKGTLMNYVEVNDVVEALTLCGENKVSIGQTYILSQSIHLERMVHTISKSLNVNHKFSRLPEIPVRFIVRVLENIFDIPLTTNRINALTGHYSYCSDKIENELNFKFKSSLEETFKLIVSQK